MPFVLPQQVKLSRASALPLGSLVDCGKKLGLCVVARDGRQNGILNLTRDKYVEYFSLDGADAEKSFPAFSGIAYGVDLHGSPANHPDDWSNKISIGPGGLDLCVRLPGHGGTYAVRRVSLSDWTLVAGQDFAGLQYYASWTLRAQYVADGEWQELRSVE